MRALYEKTIAFILQYIDENRLQEDAQLPPEAKLAVLAGVSLVTVRRALQELANQGVVRREQGRGTFVARSRLRAETTRMGSLRNGLHLDAHSKLTTRVLACTAREASAEESKALALQAGASVWELSRLRLLNRRPLILESAVIPKLLAPNLGGHFRSGRDSGSLYELLEREYGMKESREEQQLVSRPADTREEELLGLLNFEWVVEVSGVSYSARREPIDRFRLVFVAKSFAFRLAAAPAFAVEAVELA
ncbi:MAG: GntR family transcriptional regulator [Proteobacteria bacterium]|nr:GntR family transcriptional regulator [Pseudomonadota bacterium]